MHAKLKDAFEEEMRAAVRHLEHRRLNAAFFHAQRAHVLGQMHVMPHVRAHWLMLRIGLSRRAPGEIVGQLVRILLGAIGSAIGRVPVGNTGGCDISMFQRLPIDSVLSKIINDD